MSENEERAGLPETSSPPVPAPAETARTPDPETKPNSRKPALIVEALLFGLIFARGLFSKARVPGRRTPAAVPVPTPPAVPDRTPEKTGRAADRNLDMHSGSNVKKRERWGTFFIACAFALGIAAGLGFVIAYWLGGNDLLLGGTLAVFLGAFGSALVLYSHLLMLHKEAAEPREELPSSAGEREAALDEYCTGTRDVQRRGLLKWMGVAGTGLVAAMIISLLRSLGMSPYPSLFTTIWKGGERLMTAEGQPVSIALLEPGSSVTVFPEGSLGSERAQTVLIRVKEQLLQLPQDRANWAPMGYVAYSRVCTHAGCSVGLFESETHQLLCPCHQSTFDVLRAASPTGGPAARPLPQLPLYVDSDGNLRAGGGFTAPPGPGFSGMS
ncbi:MAG TPA: Rieske 2Fe-2S domain-containing protein [Bryobacteraceae bacterium]|nr:Rieske 2Fe-2S domain-containing protein [Bryobacteraceae bacterium]